MSTYTPDVPVSGQSLGNSRDIINDNFMAISELVGVNHQNFGLANQGTHIHVDLLTQASDPNPATTIVSHYSKAVSGVTEWFFQRENSGAVIQMSNGTPVASTNGKTFLPGGLLLQFGKISLPASVSGGVAQTITFSTPFTTAIYSIIAFPSDSSILGSISSKIGYTLSSVNYYFGENVSITGGFFLFWYAIGI